MLGVFFKRWEKKLGAEEEEKKKEKHTQSRSLKLLWRVREWERNLFSDCKRGEVGGPIYLQSARKLFKSHSIPRTGILSSPQSGLVSEKELRGIYFHARTDRGKDFLNWSNVRTAIKSWCFQGISPLWAFGLALPCWDRIGILVFIWVCPIYWRKGCRFPKGGREKYGVFSKWRW